MFLFFFFIFYFCISVDRRIIITIIYCIERKRSENIRTKTKITIIIWFACIWLDRTMCYLKGAVLPVCARSGAGTGRTYYFFSLFLCCFFFSTVHSIVGVFETVAAIVNAYYIVIMAFIVVFCVDPKNRQCVYMPDLNFSISIFISHLFFFSLTLSVSLFKLNTALSFHDRSTFICCVRCSSFSRTLQYSILNVQFCRCLGTASSSPVYKWLIIKQP